MSLITMPFNLSSCTKSSGTSGTYTCPSDKIAIVSVIFSNHFTKFSSNSTTGGLKTINDEVYTFLDFASPGDTFVFTESGSAESVGSATIACSYSKNSVLQQSKSLTMTAGSQITYSYSSNVSYSVLEFNK